MLWENYSVVAVLARSFLDNFSKQIVVFSNFLYNPSHLSPNGGCYIYIYIYIGVRDCPYGICCPWVRGGWDLDALGKFFRRRRRRRGVPIYYQPSTNLIPT